MDEQETGLDPRADAARIRSGIRMTWSDIAFALSLSTGTGDGQTLEDLEREYEGLL